MSAESFQCCEIHPSGQALRLRNWNSDDRTPHAREDGVFPILHLNTMIMNGIVKKAEPIIQEVLIAYPFANALIKCPMLYAMMNENAWVEREAYTIDVLHFYMRVFSILMNSNYAIDFSADGNRIYGNETRSFAKTQFIKIQDELFTFGTQQFPAHADNLEGFALCCWELTWKAIASMEILILQLCPLKELEVANHWITPKDALVLEGSGVMSPQSMPYANRLSGARAYLNARKDVSEFQFPEESTDPIGNGTEQCYGQLINDVKINHDLIYKTEYWAKSKRAFIEAFMREYNQGKHPTTPQPEEVPLPTE
jgi:hypothetical protein